MPSFPPDTPVARHRSHTLYGGWKAGPHEPILYCRDCFLIIPDPLIMEECVGKPHPSVVNRWLLQEPSEREKALAHEVQLLRELARTAEPDRDERDHYARILTEIGRVVGCNHFDGLDRCVEQTIEAAANGARRVGCKTKWLGDVAQGDRDMAQRL